MSIVFLSLLICILSIVLISLVKIERNYFISILITIFIIIFVLNLSTALSSALLGVSLVVKTIIPTIFPFSVVCNLLISYDGIGLYSKIFGPLICKPLRLSSCSSFPITASFISGYPLGCKYSTDLYKMGQISKEEYTRLLNIASNASPIFLLGAIGASLMGNVYYGLILLIANYLSVIIIGLITLPRKKSHNPNLLANSTPSKTNFGTALKNAMDAGLSTTMLVGGFVILFSIIIGIIKNNAHISIIFYKLEALLNLPSSTLYGLFLGSIEFTNGCKLITSSSLPLQLQLSIVSFICSFSGLSVIAQISSLISECNVSIKRYTLLKLLQGVISFFITYFASSILIKSIPTSSIVGQNPSSLLDTKLIIILLCILLVPLLFKIFFSKLKLHVS